MIDMCRLIMAVFRLLSVEKKAADAGFADNLSPQVAQTLMWFCKRWLQAYLLPNESHYSEVNMLNNFGFWYMLVKNKMYQIK